ncbi:response regulator transcription factor [Thiothrix nivea]|uniref:Two component transcriptional regulator, winged helix family n=1 Tax=Thiothrix nivea (strain ATCC 35100 / DSM 5205 / JP2) TaxID=870187 RepID=A0A656HKZ3_THINJ|nr:response regulator transcription factor [Thiothrix nivea]EIJ36784.1 two component transcriptional regulator, winged helix family [Thiothrix nivea DSM 5205]
MDVAANVSRKRLLIVEDNEVLCNFLQKSLQHEGYEVETLFSGERIPRLMERNCIHMVVLDILLPGKDGIYWLKWLQQYYPGVPVLIMSVKDQPDERVQGLEAGAKDYLIKPFHERELLLRVGRLLKTKTADVKQVLQIGDTVIDTSERHVSKHGRKQAVLTGLECKLLQLFYINAGIPLSRDELMRQTLGINYAPPNRTIDTHINRLRKKIEDIPSRPSYIRTVRGKGYCLYLSD